MLYLLAKLIAKFSFLAVYRKVYIINEDNVPGDRAALITCNHPNGFVEPLVIGGYIPHKIYFLVRGDVFDNKIARYFLNGVHCIPIFRFRDGFASMRKNNESINETLNILTKKKPLIIFAEGSTKQVRYVRPIQKGTIRLAFDTLEKAPESKPCIVPSFIHFSHPQDYRSEVVMEYGAPINISDYGELYQTHKAKAIKKLLDDVNIAMQTLSISVDQSVKTEDADKIFEVARSTVRDQSIYPIIQKLDKCDSRDTQKKAGIEFSGLDDTSRSNLLSGINQLNSNLKEAEIKYEQITGRTKSSFFNLIFLILGFIPFVLGRLFNILPIAFAQNFSRSKIKKIEFKAVMKLIPFLISYPIYLLVLGLVLGGIFSWKIGLSVLVLPFLGWFSYVYQGQFKELVANRKYSVLKEENRIKLKKDYEDILRKLNILSA